MIFSIDQSFSGTKGITVTSKYKHYSKVLHRLGDHLFYKFLNDIFYDVSETSRNGSIAFSKFGGSDLQIFWGLDSKIELDDCITLLRDGLNRVNKKKEYYLDKYGFMVLFHYGDDYSSITPQLKVKAKLLSNWYDFEKSAKHEVALA